MTLREYEVDPCPAVPRHPWPHGGKRYARNRGVGIEDRAVDVGEASQTDMYAGMAECAVATYLSVRHSHFLEKVDDGADCVLPDGRRVDVKWTPHAHGWLAVPTYKAAAQACDLFVLVTGRSLTLRGWMPYAELITNANRHLFAAGKPEEFAVPQYRLHPLDELRPAPLTLGLLS